MTLQLNNAKTMGPTRRLIYLGQELGAIQRKVRIADQVQAALRHITTHGEGDDWRQAAVVNIYRQATKYWGICQYYHLSHLKISHELALPQPIPWIPKHVEKSGLIWHCDAMPTSMAWINSKGECWTATTEERHQFHSELLILAITILVKNNGDEIRVDCERPYG